eukprot:gene34812-42933_t
MLPLTTNTYGNTDDSSSWCFVTTRHDSPSWGIVTCWAVSTVIDIYGVYHNDVNENLTHLSRAATVFSIMQGVLFAFVFFGMNPMIRTKWRALLFRRYNAMRTLRSWEDEDNEYRVEDEPDYIAPLSYADQGSGQGGMSFSITRRFSNAVAMELPSLYGRGSFFGQGQGPGGGSSSSSSSGVGGTGSIAPPPISRIKSAIRNPISSNNSSNKSTDVVSGDGGASDEGNTGVLSETVSGGGEENRSDSAD